MEPKFDYDKAEADLYESGCRHSEEVFDCKSKRDFDSFLRENDLRPENYYKGDSGAGNPGGSGNGSGNSGGSGSGNTGCYLTSACVKAGNLPDDCDELQTLRSYRDTYLKQREGGEEDIAYYYRVAPRIVAAIDSRADAGSIWKDLYNELVVPCVRHIKAAEMEEAYTLYRKQTEMLEKRYMGQES